LDKQEVSNNNNIAPKQVKVQPERPARRKSIIANARKLEDIKSYNNNAAPFDKNQPAGSNYE
jgi:hypothetical protein